MSQIWPEYRDRDFERLRLRQDQDQTKQLKHTVYTQLANMYNQYSLNPFGLGVKSFGTERQIDNISQLASLASLTLSLPFFMLPYLVQIKKIVGGPSCVG